MTVLCAVVSACGSGGGGDGGPVSPATVSTLAYVLSECRADVTGGTIRQRVEIRQGEQPPVTAFDTSPVELSTDALLYCSEIGRNRRDWGFWQTGVVRRLGVTPDGARVVYEVTDERAGTVVPPQAVSADEQGIFVVGADGHGRRRLAAASRAAEDDGGFVAINAFAISPSGRTIAYTDSGPGPDNEDAVQIFTLDLVREGASPFQVTTLPPGATCCPSFVDEQTIAFFTRADVDGKHPNGEHLVVTIKTDRSRLDVIPPPDAIPGGIFDPVLQITGADVSAAVLRLPGTAVNSGGGVGESWQIKEVFVFDRKRDVLQLTNFHRYDLWQATISADEQRVFFSVSGDPLGTNPSENCQIYSIDRTGGDLRQLTQFGEGSHASTGCDYGLRGRGCGAFALGRDTLSGALVFDSMCDPFGTNPNGGQIFAMHLDGTGLRQITDNRGFIRDKSSGSVEVELAFPLAFPGQIK